MEQLSLLDLEPPVLALGVKKSRLKPPLAHDLKGNSAIDSEKKRAFDAPNTTAAAVVLHHPQANRQAVLRGQALGYLLKRGQRRTIGFSVGPLGLSVSAPRWTALSAVDAALQDKADWVLRKLAQVGQLHQVLQAARMDWADGTRLAWLGGALEVRLGLPPTAPCNPPLALVTASKARLGRPMVQRLAAAAGAALPDTLWVTLPTGASSTQLRDAVQAWMMEAAYAHFTQRLDHFAPLLGVRWKILKLSSASTRWGSAKADGSIRLHWRLMQFAPAVLDYVVAHELAHLRHMDHSARFWHTVASVVPDYAHLRALLKGERLPPW